MATDRLLCVPPCVCTAFCVHRLACGPLNNKTPAVATDRLLCVPPCACTAFCVRRLACGPLNNKTPAVATSRLLCVPPCVCTAFPPHTPPPTFSAPPLPPPAAPPYLHPYPPPLSPPYLQGRGGRLRAIYAKIIDATLRFNSYGGLNPPKQLTRPYASTPKGV